MRSLVSVLSLVVLLGCGSSSPSQEPAPAPGPAEEPAGGGGEGERPLLSPEECEQRGGTVVGDIGDGATMRPDYLCPSGAPPIGNVPLGIEGSVCCPQ